MPLIGQAPLSCVASFYYRLFNLSTSTATLEYYYPIPLSIKGKKYRSFTILDYLSLFL